MYFYQKLRDLRDDHDQKQSQIAAVLGITTQPYQLYKSGKRDIPVHHLVTLAKFYNVSVDYLLGLIKTPERLDRTQK